MTALPPSLRLADCCASCRKVLPPDHWDDTPVDYYCLKWGHDVLPWNICDLKDGYERGDPQEPKP